MKLWTYHDTPAFARKGKAMTSSHPADLIRSQKGKYPRVAWGKF